MLGGGKNFRSSNSTVDSDVLNEMYKIILEFADKIRIIIEYNDNGNAVKHGNQNLRRHGSLNANASMNTYPYLDNDLVGEDNVALDGEEKNINIPNNCAQQDSILMLQTENDSQKRQLLYGKMYNEIANDMSTKNSQSRQRISNSNL